MLKWTSRAKEIGRLGISPEGGIALARILATPVIHHVAAFHPMPADAPAVAKSGAQSLLHLPHNGFSTTVLRNLALVGLPDLIPIDLLARGSPCPRLGDSTPSRLAACSD